MRITGRFAPDRRIVARVNRRANRGRRWARFALGVLLALLSLAFVVAGGMVDGATAAVAYVLAALCLFAVVPAFESWLRFERRIVAESTSRAAERGERTVTVTESGISMTAATERREARWEDIGPIREVAGVWVIPFADDEYAVMIPDSAFAPADAAALRAMLEARAAATKA